MKIILSPSKTQVPATSPFLEGKELLFPKQHKKVLAQLRKLTKKGIAKVMKLKGDLLDKTYNNIKNYNNLETSHAFMSFTGFVFFGLNKADYKATEFEYITNHVRILDALYGVLEPGTLMKEYRLDFTMKLGINLYEHWNIDSYFNEEPIINLASNEYSKMMKRNDMITITFLQKKDGKLVNQATYSKQARGLFLNYMIQNKLTEINDLKQFTEAGYQFETSISDDNTLVFVR